MRQSWNLLGWVGAVLLGVGGCHATPELKPPKEPEVLRSPDVARYDNPCQYPQEVLASDPIKRALHQDATMAPLRSRPAGMGQGGGGGAGAVGMTGMPGGSGY
jgi:hypothetical protein